MNRMNEMKEKKAEEMISIEEMHSTNNAYKQIKHINK